MRVREYEGECLKWWEVERERDSVVDDTYSRWGQFFGPQLDKAEGWGPLMSVDTAGQLLPKAQVWETRVCVGLWLWWFVCALVCVYMFVCVCVCVLKGGQVDKIHNESYNKGLRKQTWDRHGWERPGERIYRKGPKGCVLKTVWSLFCVSLGVKHYQNYTFVSYKTKLIYGER